jgi:hypothetical protein
MTIDQFLKIKTPKFKDFTNLKVGGKDQYSHMRISALRKAVPTDVLDKGKVLDLSHTEEAKIYRWFLRGLPIDFAIRKVKTDIEVNENVRHADEEREFWESAGAEDIAFDAMKDGEDLDEVIHPSRELPSVEVAGYTLIRPHINKVVISSADGEVLCEKEINNEKHWENFLQKFQASEEYRKECVGAKEEDSHEQ